MSLQIHMKIDGVTGEAESFKYKGWCEIFSWNWGMTSNRKSITAKDGIKTMMNEIAVIKPIGIDSTQIRNLYALGEVIPSVQLIIAPIVGKREPQSNYVNIIMEDALIKSVVTGGGLEEEFYKEHLTIIFDRITFECNRPVKSKDDVDSNDAVLENDFRWDVMGNKKWENQVM